MNREKPEEYRHVQVGLYRLSRRYKVLVIARTEELADQEAPLAARAENHENPIRRGYSSG
jgi:hypothetical protein